MISISPQSRVLVQIEPLDFRKGLDGISGRVREVLSQDPFSGAYFVFRNGKGTGIKILFFDGQGLWLAQKRLSEGRLRFWPTKNITDPLIQLAAREVHTLLWNGDPRGARFAPEWRQLPMVV